MRYTHTVYADETRTHVFLCMFVCVLYSEHTHKKKTHQNQNMPARLGGAGFTLYSHAYFCARNALAH